MSRTGEGKIVVFFHDEGDNKIYPIGLTKEQVDVVTIMQEVLIKTDRLRVIDEPIGEFVNLSKEVKR